MRFACLALAVWLAGASALMGCAFAMAQGNAAAEKACHQGVSAAPQPSPVASHDCCNLPVGQEPEQGPQQGQVEECCFSVALATMGKSKPPEVKIVESERLPASTELRAPVGLGAVVETFVADARGDYLLLHVLRI
jgi:hypothetical protein